VRPSLPPTSWERVFAIDYVVLGELIEWRRGLIAFGCTRDAEPGCRQRFFLTSPNGLTWERVDFAVSRDRSFGGIVHVGRRLFSLGYVNGKNYAGAIVWTSTDGHSWTRIRSTSFEGRSLRRIVRTPFGTFALGYNAPPDSDNTSGFLLWRVRDDDSFGPMREIDTGGVPALVSNAGWTGDEFLAWGLKYHPMAAQGPTIVLASSDGSRWVKRSAIAGGRLAVVFDIVGARGRLFAVGYQGREVAEPHIWVSDDSGRSWTNAVIEGEDAMVEAIERDGSRFVARGITGSHSTPRAVSWESDDGLVWTRVPDDQDLPFIEGFSAASPVTVDGRTCVAGMFSEPTPTRAAIYCREINRVTFTDAD